jgi:crotonobetainyl-CoA:carnitine CoA-transferase CaiB-like acyl-CoA transferase
VSWPLAGIQVVALEQAVAAPLCTRHLADLGADVVKVERPDGGDFARHYDSVVQGQSAYFVWLNRGKRSAALNVKAPADRALLDALLARADVFVHNLGPGAVERLGLGWETLHARWPRLISCAISGYGPDGPYRDRKAFDLLLQGESGVISVTGTPEAPAKPGISIADICAGMYSFSAVLAALYERERTGQGTLIEISMLECLAEWMMPPVYHQLYGGTPPPRTGMRHNLIVPYGPYRAGDGWVNLAVQNEGQWRRLCAVVLRRPELADHPRYCTNELRVQHRDSLEPLIEEILAADTRASALARLEEADVPYGALNDVADLIAHPQLAARDRWYDVPSPAGPIRAFRPPFNLRGLPQPAGGVPAIGEHTEALRRELGLAD